MNTAKMRELTEKIFQKDSGRATLLNGNGGKLWHPRKNSCYYNNGF